MIIIWDRVENGSAVKWDDDNEQLIVVRPAMDPAPGQYPIEILMTDYELIQYMEVYTNSAEAMKFIKQEFTDEELQKKATNVVLSAIQGRAKPDKTGSLIQKHTYPMGV